MTTDADFSPQAIDAKMKRFANGADAEAGSSIRKTIERRVRGFTAGGTDEQIAAIVDRIALTGECVMHATAKIAGKPCFCHDCRPDIKRFA